jgi:hypothetical protein
MNSVVEKVVYSQILDYIKIPFKCGHCHGYGHIVEDYSQYFLGKLCWRIKFDVKMNGEEGNLSQEEHEGIRKKIICSNHNSIKEMSNEIIA